MPAWFMAMPSQMPMTPNSRGMPPADAHAGLDRVDDAAQVQWPGTTSLKELATPMNGRSISASLTPSARSSERCGARATTVLDLVASHGHASLLVAGGRPPPLRARGREPEMIPETPCLRRGWPRGRAAAIGAPRPRAS